MILPTAPPGTAGSEGDTAVEDSTVQVTPKSNDDMTFTVDEHVVVPLSNTFPVATIITPLVAADVETDTNTICIQQRVISRRVHVTP